MTRISALIGASRPLAFECAPEPPQDHRPPPLVRRLAHLVIDVERELCQIIVPVGPRHRLGRHAPLRLGLEEGAFFSSQIIDIIEPGPKDAVARNDAARDRLLQRQLRRLFAMGEEHRLGDRFALFQPCDELRRIGMAGIILEIADRRFDLDLIPMNPNRFFALEQEPAKRTLGLETDRAERSLRASTDCF